MASSLELLYNHLVLPPKLPDQGDTDVEVLERNLFNRLSKACSIFVDSGHDDVARIYAPVAESLKTASKLNQGRLDKCALYEALSQISTKGYIILYVVKQNAALIIRRVESRQADYIIFEAYEASPDTASVLAAEGAMDWGFPSRATSMQYCEFLDIDFLQNLASVLEQASAEALPVYSARSSKAQRSVIEVRDTANPAFVTQWLMTIIEASDSAAHTPKIWKRVRDDVNFDDANFPGDACHFG